MDQSDFTGCKITGTGQCVPEKILTNDDLSKLVETSDEWISTRTGIKERRILEDGQTIMELAANAGRAALQNAGVLPEEIDYIVCATIHGDYITPSLSCCVQKLLGMRCPTIDINTACAGFLYGLDVAQSFIRSKKEVHKVLMIAADAMSRLVDWSDRNTCVLFGDGAGAAVIEENPEECLLSFVESSNGNWEVLHVDYGEGGHPCTFMNGGEVFKFAVTSACRDITEAAGKAGITDLEEISHVILHQANQRITKSVQSKLGIAAEKYISTIHKYGNTSASGIAMALNELNQSGSLKPGELIAFAAFGGGLTSAAAIIRW